MRTWNNDVNTFIIIEQHLGFFPVWPTEPTTDILRGNLKQYHNQVRMARNVHYLRNCLDSKPKYLDIMSKGFTVVCSNADVFEWITVSKPTEESDLKVRQPAEGDLKVRQPMESDLKVRQRMENDFKVKQPTDTDLNVNDECTILDWLNEDCLWLVLDYVPFKDIICSERVSRRWRGAVHQYLKDVGICVAYLSGYFTNRDVKIEPKNRILEIEDIYGLETIWGPFREKWGLYMAYTFCTSWSDLEHIALCCPNLKGLAIHMYRFGTGPLSQNQKKLCDQLVKLVFVHLPHFYDDKDRNEYEQDADEDKCTYCYGKEKIARAFFSNLEPTKLKSLTVCGMFDFCHILSSIRCFPKLTKLNVQGFHTNISVLFEKTPKLERLVLMESSIDLGSYKPRLSVFNHLKHLTLNEFSGAKWLESLADCELETLVFIHVDTEVKETAIKLLRTRWRTLTDIKMDPWCSVTDDDVAVMIASCPNLTTLDVSNCELSSELIARAAAAARDRSVPLRLKIGGTEAAFAPVQDASPNTPYFMKS